MAGFLHFAGSGRLVAPSLNISICRALGIDAQGGTYLLPACSPLPKTACESVEKAPGASAFSGQKESQLLPKASRNLDSYYSGIGGVRSKTCPVHLKFHSGVGCTEGGMEGSFLKSVYQQDWK